MPEDAEFLIAVLRRGNVIEQCDAARRLGGVPCEKAMLALRESLRSSAWEVRQAAADALGRIGHRRAVGALLNAMHDPHEAVRLAAILALGWLGDLCVIPPLVRVLQISRVCEIQCAAATALGALGHVSAVPVLVRLMRRERGAMRTAAANALAEIGDIHTLPGKILAAPRLTPAERVTLLRSLHGLRHDGLRAAFGTSDIRGLCLRTLQSGDLRIHATAKEMLGVLDGATLLRPSFRARSEERNLLLRAAQSPNADLAPEELLRGADAPPVTFDARHPLPLFGFLRREKRA